MKVMRPVPTVYPDPPLIVREKDDVPDEPGVYFLWCRHLEWLEYVGMSKVSMRERLSSRHQYYRKKYHLVSWLQFDCEMDMIYAEAYYIGKFTPRGNFNRLGWTQQEIEERDRERAERRAASLDKARHANRLRMKLDDSRRQHAT